MNFIATVRFVALALITAAAVTGCAAEAEPEPQGSDESNLGGVLGAAAGIGSSIQIPAGQSSVTVNGAIARGDGAKAYSLSARKGQVLALSAFSPGNAAVFELQTSTGRTISDRDVQNLTTVLPETGTYRVIVGASRGNASFSLQVTIKDPKAIVFPSGSRSVTLPTASVLRGERAYYTFTAGGGQRVAFNTAAQGQSALLDIYDFRGKLLTDATDQTSRRVVLPSDGRALIEVGPDRGNVTFRLTAALE
jgi:hypothetical protein